MAVLTDALEVDLDLLAGIAWPGLRREVHLRIVIVQRLDVDDRGVDRHLEGDAVLRDDRHLEHKQL